MSSGLKDCADPKQAASFAHKSRTARAGEFNGGMPPAGPRKEPTLTNGIKAPKERGMSK